MMKEQYKIKAKNQHKDFLENRIFLEKRLCELKVEFEHAKYGYDQRCRQIGEDCIGPLIGRVISLDSGFYEVLCYRYFWFDRTFDKVNHVNIIQFELFLWPATAKGKPSKSKKTIKEREHVREHGFSYGAERHFVELGDIINIVPI